MEKKKLDKRIVAISEKLRLLRIDAGFTSYESFAKKHDLPRVQYWRIETGTNFTMETFLKVLDAHQISLEDFFQK